MKLLVFCHANEAYMVPDKVCEQAKVHDMNYDECNDGFDDAVQFFADVKKKYKPIECGYLLTGDV